MLRVQKMLINNIKVTGMATKVWCLAKETIKPLSERTPRIKIKNSKNNKYVLKSNFEKKLAFSYAK